MPKMIIIAQGPPASGKSQLIRHFYQNLPEGYKLEKQNALEAAFGLEVWVLDIKKLRAKKGKR